MTMEGPGDDRFEVRFSARVLELLRQVERTGQPIVITERGTPVLTLAPYRSELDAPLNVLRKSVIRYKAPTKLVAEDDSESD